MRPSALTGVDRTVSATMFVSKGTTFAARNREVGLKGGVGV